MDASFGTEMRGVPLIGGAASEPLNQQLARRIYFCGSYG
jgi:hypothetical protein